jgi:hypothetical protein
MEDALLDVPDSNEDEFRITLDPRPLDPPPDCTGPPESAGKSSLAILKFPPFEFVIASL